MEITDRQSGKRADKMLLKQIKYFISIADTGSFTEAAAQCFISQSAVSKQISFLEAELGVQLIERQPRSVLLTDAGRYLYKYGRQLIEDAEKLKRGVLAASIKYGERFTIACLSDSMTEFLYLTLAKFKKQHPHVIVDVYITGQMSAFAELESGQADVLLSNRPVPPGNEVDSFYLVDKACFIELSSTYDAAEKPLVTAADLKNLPCIIVSSDKERDIEQKYYRDFFGLKNYSIFVPNMEDAELMAAAGNGFIVSDSDKCRHGLKKVPFYAGNSQLMRSYHLYSVNGANKNVRSFAEIMKNTITV
jgi:DNA-binding transcriptional LysR family regulator